MMKYKKYIFWSAAAVIALAVLVTGYFLTRPSNRELYEWMHAISFDKESQVHLWVYSPYAETTDWCHGEKIPLSDDKVREFEDALYQISKKELVLNQDNAGGTPEWGIGFTLNGEDFHLDEAYAPGGALEVGFDNRQWWIDNEKLTQLLKSWVSSARTLTMEKVKALVQKGENLGWREFAIYPHKDIGSGLYVYRYEIDENYYVLIGGASQEEPPMYIRLVSAKDSEKYIDIRTERIEDFIV